MSMDANNEPTAGIQLYANLLSDFSTITTYTKSANMPASSLIAYY